MAKNSENKRTFNCNCSTREQLVEAQKRKRTAKPSERINIYVVCRKDRLQTLPHEKKILIVGAGDRDGIYCRKHAFEVAKELETSLLEADFEEQLLRLMDSGVSELYIYTASKQVLTAT